MTLRIPLFSLVILCGIQVALLGDDALRIEPEKQTATLEGTLKVHPKYLYRYYLADFGDGQKCALFGLEEELKGIKPGSGIRVEGQLGTRFHSGSTASNLSPFPRTWYIYMTVEAVKVLREPIPPSDPSQPLPGTR